MGQILLNPNTSTPQDLTESLFYVNEMRTQESFDAIQNAIDGTDIDVAISEDAAYADLAIQVWMQDRQVIERIHAEQFLLRPRSFEYFKTTTNPVPDFVESCQFFIPHQRHHTEDHG